MNDATFSLLVGDAREQMRELPEESVHAVVTSPPYWQLRDYETEPLAWADGWTGELGQEDHPDSFVRHLVEVFEEVRRVLRSDGVCFLNIDDTFCANRTYQVPSTKAGDVGNRSGMRVPAGLKAKELALVPARLALALQEAGWWVRCDDIWAPPNAMPESVTDRPTRSHEYVFMLSKTARYFWDQESVREGAVEIDGFTLGRNLRSVWPIPTENFYGEHYAVMPVKLASQCIAAATSAQGCCGECGAPRERVVERRSLNRNELPPDHPEWRPSRYDNGKAGSDQAPGAAQRYSATRTLGWKASCVCGQESVVPATVLDPFGGAMTTALAAMRIGRSSISIELSPEAAEVGRRRMDAWWKDSQPVRSADESQMALDVSG